MQSTAFVEFEGVSKRYGRSDAPFVLQGVDLGVGKGERLLILGASGSGKTTLLNLAAGVDRPDRGKIHAAGEAISALSENRRARWRARNAGYVFQHHYLPHGTTALDLVAFPLLWAQGASPQVARRMALAALERVGLDSHSGQRVETLSGGQRQRVAVARAIVTNPPLLLADEPTAQLDRDLGRQVVDMLVEWALEKEASFITVSHEAETGDWKEDRRLKLQDGTLSELASAG